VTVAWPVVGRLAHGLRQAPWRFVPLLGLHVVLRALYFRGLTLPEEAYFAPVVAWEVLRRPAGAVLLLAPCAIGALACRGRAWRGEPYGGATRALVVVAAVAIAYPLAAGDVNLYHGQVHAADRVLVLAAALAVALHPAAAAVLVGLAIAMVGQFHHPIGFAFPWTEARPLYELLVLFVAFTLADLSRRYRAGDYLFLALCLVASGYLWAGLTKLPVGWLAHADLVNLAVNSHVNGWLRGVDDARFYGLIESARWLNQPLAAAALAVELAAIGLLWRRALARGLLLAWVLFHLGVFALSGSLFWQWMVVAVTLMILLRPRGAAEAAIFGRPGRVWVSAAIVLSAPLHFGPDEFGWLHTRLNVFHELEVVGDSGRVYPVERNFMAPYDAAFAESTFFYLTPNPVLVGMSGGTPDLRIFRALDSVADRQALEDVEARLGTPRFDAGQAARLDRFLATFFANLNTRGSKRPFRLAPPALPNMWHAPIPGAYRGQEPARMVRVRFVKTLYQAGRIEVLTDQVVRVIPVEPSPDAPAPGRALSRYGDDAVPGIAARAARRAGCVTPVQPSPPHRVVGGAGRALGRLVDIGAPHVHEHPVGGLGAARALEGAARRRAEPESRGAVVEVVAADVDEGSHALVRASAQRQAGAAVDVVAAQVEVQADGGIVADPEQAGDRRHALVVAVVAGLVDEAGERGVCGRPLDVPQTVVRVVAAPVLEQPDAEPVARALGEDRGQVDVVARARVAEDAEAA
jgi:hypothetical protein